MPKKKIFIEALEQRIMLDGAGASTFMDVVEESNKEKPPLKSSKEIAKFKEIRSVDNNNDLPFANVTRDKVRKKQIVFIDTQISDYQTLIDSFDKNTKVVLIEANEDGFKKIEQSLKGEKKYSAIHIIGHGSAGQILFGNALLTNENIEDYKSTLKNIGQNLTVKGDILFYGCNIAANEKGENLIKRISKITKADIAASDDITGKGGDWQLEKKFGIIETKNIEVANYESSLANGVASTNNKMYELHDNLNFKSGSGSGGIVRTSFWITREREGITSGTLNLQHKVGVNDPPAGDMRNAQAGTYVMSTTNPVDVYLIACNKNQNSKSMRDSSKAGQVTFDRDIIGVDFTNTQTSSNNGVTVHNPSGTYTATQGGRAYESYKIKHYSNIHGSRDTDWVAISGKSLKTAVKNGTKGDFIRVYVKGAPSNTDPTARADEGVVNEGATLTVANSDNANVTGSYDANGEHSGDIMDTSSATNADEDDDGDAIEVTHIQHISAGSATAVTDVTYSHGTATSVTGTYGTLTIGSDGSYEYVADQTAANALASGETANDEFTYTITDANSATATATLTIKVLGVNDAPVAQNDEGVIVENGTLTVANGANDNVSGSYDATGEHSGDVIDTSSSSNSDSDVDASDTLSITQIKKNGGTNSAVSSGSSYNSSGTSVTGAYGVLTIGADGSYTYDANTTVGFGPDQLGAGQTVTDRFIYTLSDGTTTTTANIDILVIGVNDAPIAQNDEGVINEGATLTVNDGNARNSNGDIDATNEHSGDVVQTTSSTHKDNDYDQGSNALSVTVIRTGSIEGSGTIGTLGEALSGTYGSLTLESTGAYTYVANNNITGLDSGESVTDVFNYTVSDGTATDTATITITILGQGTAISATNDTDSVNEDATVTKTGSQDDLLNDDAGDSITVTQVKPNGGSYSSVQASSTYNSNGTSITGTYGTIVFGADGSYTYTADQSAADAMEAGQTETDVFVYEITDSAGATTTATLTITVTGVNDAPTAQNDAGIIQEGLQLNVVGNAYGGPFITGTMDTSGEHTGPVIHTSRSSNQDSDPDVNPTLTVSAIRKGSSEGNGDAGTVGASFSGTYGALTIYSDGQYSYIANSDITGLYSGDSRTEYFNYTLSDEDGATDTAVIQITILGTGTAPANNAPVARDDAGYINEGATLTVSDGDNPNVSGSYDATGEHTGDVINTNSTSNYDTDADGHTITVASFRTGSTEGSGTAGILGSALTGTYGQLTLNDDGSYTYVANQSAANALASGESATDSFNYTISDGNAGTDTAVLTITIYGVNDAPTAVDDTDSVDENGTVTKTGSQNDALNDDTDPDSSDSLVVTHIQPGSGSTSTVSSSSTYDSNGTSVTGTYGTLTIGADGSYTYTADQSAADDLDAGDEVTDVFTYTISDGNGGTDTATITITVTGINDAPVAQNDEGVVGEDDTLTVANSANASVTGSYDAAGEHSGDVIDTSSSSHTDSDADDSASLSISAIRTGQETGSGTSGTVGVALTGTYGQLTLNADGSYTYVANQDAADALSASGAYDYFTYTLTDGTATDTAEIKILVLGDDNDRPTATDGSVYINENNTDATHGTRTASNITYTFSSTGSEFNYSDVENDTFTKIRIKSLPSNGTLHRLDANGFITGTFSVNDFVENFDRIHYVPDANSEADDSFEYRVNDGSLTSSSNNTMNIYVNAAPVAVSDTDSITAGNSAETGNVITNDTDSDDSTSVMTITGVGAGAESSTLPNRNVGSAVSGTYGTLTLNSDGSYSYDVSGNAATIALANGATATDTFSYKVKDDETNAGSKALDIGIITFTITGIDEGVTANNDSITVSTSQGSKTITNGHAKDAEGNDSNNGDGDTLTITNFATGASEGFGSTSAAGSTVSGDYGTLKLNADGSYTYTTNSTLVDDENLQAGSPPIYDYFWYTISDGNSTDTAVITIKIVFQASTGPDSGDPSGPTGPEPGDESGDESSSDKKGKGKNNKDSRNDRKQRRSEKIDTPELELPPSTARDAAEFNQGLKLVDLVAESKSVDAGGNEDIDTLKAKFTKEGMRVKFKVFNDEGKEIQKYYGVMKDGSPLPNWIKVDPKTGKTTTNIPKGMKLVEFKIVAIDLDNNEKQVTVVIDPKKIAQDKDILKQIRKGNKTKVDVRTDGSVELQSTDQTGSIDRTTSNILNNNRFNEFSKMEPTEKLNLETKILENKFILDIPEDFKQSFKAFKVLQRNGEEVPEWIKIDTVTGQIIAEPPKDIENIKLKIIAENENGEISVKEIELEFKKENENTGKLIDPETNFEPLNAQLAKEKVNFDDYGDKIIQSL